jgi:hypothetical protein
MSNLQSGGNDAVKVPVAGALNTFVRSKVAALAALAGHGLPCTVSEVLIGPLVTVTFNVSTFFNLPPITVPVGGTFEYQRIPIQVGAVGRVLPTGISPLNIVGASKTRPNLGLDGNLATLVFEPLSGPVWPNLGLPGNVQVFYGVNGGGVMLQDSATGATITVTTNKTGGFAVAQGTLKLTLNNTTVTVTNGGTPAAVVTTAGNSTVLFADG